MAACVGWRRAGGRVRRRGAGDRRGTARRGLPPAASGTPPPACWCAAATASAWCCTGAPPDKLVFADTWDCWAGGVVGPGEDPADAAVRELAEELGITGAPLTPLPHARYDDGARVRYHAFTYEARWDGPLRPEPTEIAWAGWVTLGELVERLADPERWPFAPDGRAGIERWLAARADA